MSSFTSVKSAGGKVYTDYGTFELSDKPREKARFSKKAQELVAKVKDALANLNLGTVQEGSESAT
jgi:hypothetical protein